MRCNGFLGISSFYSFIFKCQDVGHLDKNKQTNGIGIFQIKQTLTKLKKDDAGRLADACADWLGKTLCNGAFQKWRSGYKYVSSYRLT